jgi:hypothetical protein
VLVLVLALVLLLLQRLLKRLCRCGGGPVEQVPCAVAAIAAHPPVASAAAASAVRGKVQVPLVVLWRRRAAASAASAIGVIADSGPPGRPVGKRRGGVGGGGRGWLGKGGVGVTAARAAAGGMVLSGRRMDLGRRDGAAGGEGRPEAMEGIGLAGPGAAAPDVPNCLLADSEGAGDGGGTGSRGMGGGAGELAEIYLKSFFTGKDGAGLCSGEGWWRHMERWSGASKDSWEDAGYILVSQNSGKKLVGPLVIITCFVGTGG